MIRWATIVLAVVGLAIGVYAVSTSKDPTPDLPLAREASVNPFAKGVAALGIVEPAGRNVGVVAPEAGLVVEVFVDVGDSVAKGRPLFRLDERQLRADLVRAEAALGAAEQEIARWRALPRAEDVPPLEAAVERAAAVVADRREDLDRLEEGAKRGAANDRDVLRARFAVQAAEADLAGRRADLDRLKAGGWAPDLAILEANLAQRRSEVQALKLLIERLTVVAPRDGVVLRRNVEAGEYASVSNERPAMILGNLDALNVRAQVDEEDIALIGETPKAVGRTRGAVVATVELTLVRIEPFARRKSDLAGDNLERVDTRVIDVVFAVKGPAPLRLFPGQSVDVFVEADAVK